MTLVGAQDAADTGFSQKDYTKCFHRRTVCRCRVNFLNRLESTEDRYVHSSAPYAGLWTTQKR